MSRFALLSCCLALLACGADSAAKQPTTELHVAPESSQSDFLTIAGGARSIAIYQEAAEASPAILTISQGLQGWSRDGKALPLGLGAGLQGPRLVDVQGDELWAANRGQLQALDLPSQKLGKIISLPEGAQITAIEAGYRGTVFVADADAMRIIAASEDKTETLVEGAELGHPQALLLNGGSLIIASSDKLLSFDIKSRESKVLSSELGSVVGLAHDHLGYFVALTASGEIRQVQGDGSSRLLHTLAKPASALAFDAQSRTLYAAGSDGVAILDYLELTGEDKALWAKRDTRLMRSYRKHGMTVAGGEYWPSHGTTNVSYPDDILWGFYPSPEEVNEGSASKVAPPAAAIACAESSYRALQSFVDENPAKFHRAAEARHASKQFYLWVNDYSDAAADFPHEQRPSKFWYWQREPAVTGRVPGFWKWETTLMQDGSCHWPQPEQIASYLDETLAGAR